MFLTCTARPIKYDFLKAMLLSTRETQKNDSRIWENSMERRTEEASKPKNIGIFCCYADKDRAFFSKLKAHLMPLQREEHITLWTYDDIKVGKDRKKELRRYLNTAQIILLLVSPDFLASDSNIDEMQWALERHEHEEVYVIPIILRPIAWQAMPFGNLQVLPTDANPISSSKWHTQDDAFYNVAEGIRRVVKECQNEQEQLQNKIQPSTSESRHVQTNEMPEAKISGTTPPVSNEQKQAEYREVQPRSLKQQLLWKRPVQLRNLSQRRPILLLTAITVLMMISSALLLSPNFLARGAGPTSSTKGPSASIQAVPTETEPVALLRAVLSRQPTYHDSLQQDNKGWVPPEGSGNVGQCKFDRAGLHVFSTPLIFGFADKKACTYTNQDFGNVAVQVKLTLLKGHSGGIYCRFSTDWFHNYSGYLFEINSDGQYNISGVNTNEQVDWQDIPGNPQSGHNVTMIVTMIAIKNSLYFYINGHSVREHALIDNLPNYRATATADISTATAIAKSGQLNSPTATAISNQATADAQGISTPGESRANGGVPPVHVHAGEVALLSVAEGSSNSEALYSDLNIYAFH